LFAELFNKPFVSLAFKSADDIIGLPLATIGGIKVVDKGIEDAVWKFVSSKSRCNFANSGQSLTIDWMLYKV
jgi:hypothetical protein